jgi:predicted AAA+ superfamily ATPase
MPPRQTGKSTLLRHTYPKAPRIDLLSSREFARFARNPGILREEIEASRDPLVIIDEVQKVHTLSCSGTWSVVSAGEREGAAGTPGACPPRRRSP